MGALPDAGIMVKPAAGHVHDIRLRPGGDVQPVAATAALYSFRPALAPAQIRVEQAALHEQLQGSLDGFGLFDHLCR